MDKSKIIEKIRNLKALASSDNEYEAMRSLEFMQKYMDKYNITEDMLGKLNNDELKVDKTEWVKPNGRSMRRWEIRLSSSVAEMFGCRIVINSSGGHFGRNKKRSGILFIGVEDDREIATEMYGYLKEVIHNEALKHLQIEKDKYEEDLSMSASDIEHMNKNKDPDMIDLKTLKKELEFSPRAFVNSFEIGCTNRIGSRIEKIIKERRENYEHQQNTTALKIVNWKLEKVEKFIDDMDCGTLDTGMIISSMIGNAKGQEVGDKVSLDNQITAKANDLGQRLIR